MGRRRRRVIRIVKKKLPTVFVCPKCGEEAVRVTIAKDTGKATVLCALCSLKDEFQAHPAAQMIDVYSYFTDRFYGVKDPRPIIPREREAVRETPEEVPREPVSPETAIVESEPHPPTVVEAAEHAITETSPPEAIQAFEETSPPVTEQTEQTAVEAPDTPKEEGESGPEEDSEPFADILQSKDKKRYSPNPLPGQSSE